MNKDFSWRIRFLTAVWIALFALAPVSGEAQVAAYSFNEGTGTTVADATGNGHTGTLTNATWTTSGKFDNALSFNGSNSFVTIADHADLDLTTGMTLEAWVNPANSTGWRTVILKETNGDLSYALYESDDSSLPNAYIGGTGINGSSELPTNTWTHLAATYDGSTMRLYVNGVQAASGNVGAISPSSNPLKIGGNAVWGEYFSGLIDEVRIYNTALTPSEIQADMAAAVDGTPPTYQCSDGLDNDSDGYTDYPDDPGCTGVTDNNETDPVTDTEAPTTPANLSATAQSASAIALSWDASSDNIGVTAYDVERCEGTGCSNFAPAASVSNTSYVDSTLSGATLYRYRVQARDEAGNTSAFSSIASATTDNPNTNETLRYHQLQLDSEDKIVPWYGPADVAYDHYLYTLWTWLPTVPTDQYGLPLYYLYCGFYPGNPISGDSAENDWGERIPNFVEFGRLYYAYSGDRGPLDIARGMADYALDHAMTPANYAWPNFPFGTADAGEPEITGRNVAWSTDDVLVDLGSDMGMSFYKLYLIYGDPAYRDAAINTADVLAANMQAGNAEYSPLPYAVNARTGQTSGRYTSNFAGALTLFDLLIEHNEPNAAAYETARATLRAWILAYPMQNGNWVDGHSDVFVDGNDNWSNTTKSNMNLYLLDNPSFDPNFSADVLSLIQWSEDNMVNVPTGDGFPAQYYGASVVAEQFAYMMRMGYQTARLAAEYAGLYELTGNETYKDKAYRGYNFATYMMEDDGLASDGPTDGVGWWWGDVYAEGPRMFFFGFRAVPEWSPEGEDHILYSRSILSDVTYENGEITYTTSNAGMEYIHTTFQPAQVTVGGIALTLRTDLLGEGYTAEALGNGDYLVKVNRTQHTGAVLISDTLPGPDTTAPTVSVTAPQEGATVGGTVTVSAAATDNVGVVGVQFFVNGSALGAEDTASPYSIVWDASATSDGPYSITAVARDAADNSATSDSVTVTVNNTTPFITTQPQDTSAAVGSTATFSVTAEGTPPLSYQWKKDDADISGATASTYTTPALAFADNGSAYSVTVTNNTGSVTSDSAVLTVINTETIWGSRTTTSFNSDNQPWDLGMIFTPTVDGEALGARVYGAPNESGAHSVRLWRNDGTLLSGPHTFTYSGQGWHEFTFPAPVTLTADTAYTITVSTGGDNAGWYTAVGSDLTSGGDNGADLTYPANGAVYSDTIGVRPTQSWQSENYLRDILFAPTGGTPDTEAPSIPANLAVTGQTDSSVSLSWDASSDNVGVLAYELYRCTGSSCTPATLVTTTAGTSYTDTGLASGTAYTYRVRAMDAAGNTSGYSGEASGTTVAVDTEAPSVSIDTPASGATVSGSVTISATASDNIGVAGVQFKVDGVDLGSEDTTSPYSLTWDTTQETDGSHSLSAVARDAAGNTDTDSITITVDNPDMVPSIITQPQDAATAVGGTATFSVSAEGTPPFLYQWKKDDADISGATASTYTTPALTFADNGSIYSVTVTNNAGSVTSDNAVLTVINTETIWGSRTTTSFNSDNQSWDLGMIFTPTVDGEALGARVYGAPNESGAHSVRLWRNDGTLLSGPHTFTYSGQGWHEFTFPAPVTLTANTAYTITVSTGGDNAGWYTAVGSDLTSGGNNGLHLTYPANGAVYSDTVGVRPTQSWQSENYLRDILFSATGGGGTPDTEAPSIPANLAVISQADSSLTLSWNASSDNVGVFAYDLYRCTGSSCTPATVVASTADTSYTDTGLASETTYTYRVRARDAAGNTSGYSGEASGTTAVSFSGNLTVQGASTAQQVDGVGTNIHSWSWKNGELRPALDELVDDLGYSVFRVVHDRICWAACNDSARPDALLSALQALDPATLDSVYGTSDMEDFWDTIQYLNAKGIGGDQITLNFMGWTPVWMGGSAGYGVVSRINAANNDDFALMIASLVYYAKNVKGLDFSYVGPMNEQDHDGLEGPQVGETQYANIIASIATLLDTFGINDVKIVAPDAAGDSSGYVSALLANSVASDAIAHFGEHTYGGELYPSAAFGSKTGWVTETSAGCGGCDNNEPPSQSEWNFGAETADILLADIANGYGAVMNWEGFDTFYYHHDSYSAWGSVGCTQNGSGCTVSDAYPRTYAIRDRAYPQATLARAIRPGMTMVGVDTSLSQIDVIALYDSAQQRLSIVGHNTSGSSVTINGQLLNTPVSDATLALYLTNATQHVAHTEDVDITSGTFTAVIPANTFFSLTNVVLSAFVDTEAPSVSLDTPASGATVSDAVTVSATASDDIGIVGVQFKLDGVDLGAEDTTSPYSLTWDTTQAANGSHSLSAVARDLGGNTATDSIPVMVDNPDIAPSITAQPQDITTAAGNTAMFSVTVEGTPPLSYQWLKNGSNITGATDSTYTTPALVLSDSGSSYRVTVSNSVGSVMSSSATLTVTNTTETIWGDRTSPSFNSDGRPWDLGMIFTPTVNGEALGARVYGAPNESGTHSVRLWRNSDGALLSGPHTFTYSGEGWHEFTFPAAVALQANQAYTVTVSTGSDNSGWYTTIGGDLISGGDNGLHLVYPANAAVYSETVGDRPTDSYESENYLRDIIFAPGN